MNVDDDPEGTDLMCLEHAIVNDIKLYQDTFVEEL